MEWQGRAISPAPPRHVGLIPAGTRRWARREGVGLEQAYGMAVDNVARVVTRLYDHGVSAVSVHMLSRRSLSRPAPELQAILRAEVAGCTGPFLDLCEAFGAHASIAGRLGGLPAWYVVDMQRLARVTRNMTMRRLYLCVAYDPFEEVQAAQAPGRPASPAELLARMWVPDRLDLVIRTAGAQRLSDFLPLQAACAELVFHDATINELRIDDVDEILGRYAAAVRPRS